MRARRQAMVRFGVTVWLLTFHEVRAAGSKATPAPDAASAKDAAAGPKAPPAREDSSRPAERLSPRSCGQIRQRVERQLTRAQRCKRDGECAGIDFEYAFRPCGTSVRIGATLAKVTTDAKLYRERCNPVIRPVRCPHTPRAVCDQGRCALAATPTR